MPDIYPTSSRVVTVTFTDADGASDPDEVTFTLLVKDPYQQVLTHEAMTTVANPAVGTYTVEVDSDLAGSYTVHAQGSWGAGDSITYQSVQTSWYVRQSDVVPLPAGS